MKEWFVYLLECNDGTYYCGATNNVEKRLKTHNNGTGAKYTRSRLPCVIVGFKGNMTHSEALKLEFAIKKMTRIEKRQFFV